MTRLLLCGFVAAVFCAATVAAQETDQLHLKEEAAILEATLEEVSKKCRKFRCLLIAKEREIPRDVLSRLAKHAKVEMAQPADLERDEHGYARGFVKPGGGRIFEVGAITVASDGRSGLTTVKEISGPLGENTCDYVLRRTGSAWHVVSTKTRCTV